MEEHVLLIGTKYFSFCARNGNHDFLSKMCNFRTLVTETTSDESSLLR